MLALCLSGAQLSFSQAKPAEIAQNNNRFAFDLYRQIAAQEKGNVFISPFSISTALAMTYAGADKNTAAEMAKTLHFDANTPEFHMAYGKYIERLEKNAEGNINWRVANRIWGDKKFILMPAFIELNRIAYRSPLQLLDFMKQPEKSRITINTWVEEQTEGRIKNLIPSGAITPLTRLVLTNAIYFKADWLNKFEKELTKDDTFTKTDGSKSSVPFMNRRGALSYAQTQTYQAVRLPYKGNKHSMAVVLPSANTTMETLEKEFGSRGFDALYSGYSPEVILSLPKFKATLGLSLGSYLQKMGMPEAFTGAANFSKMAEANNLFISEVIHKAFIEIDEEGTEAAAATAVIMMEKSSIGGERPKPIVFKANRPFLFYILDDETHSILFMGRMMNPEAK